MKIQKIGIVLAAFNPDPVLFLAQLLSIQNQTEQNWVCLVSFDSPMEELKEHPEFQRIQEDSRFRWIENPNSNNLKSAKKNFEFGATTLLQSDPLIDALAFSDQDDLWYPDKLQKLKDALESKPRGSLVHSDMHLIYGKGIDLAGVDQSTSAWKVEKRGVQHCSLQDLLIRNCVAGAGLLMDAHLWRRFPTIPDGVPFHDHWAAILAASNGGIYSLYEPLYAYRQHQRNVLGITEYSGRLGYHGRKSVSGFLNTVLSRFHFSRQITEGTQRAGLEISPQNQRVFLGAEDFGLGFLKLGVQYFSSDPALSKACFARAVGKLLWSLF